MQELKFSKRKQTQNRVIDAKEYKAYVGKESDLQRQCEHYLEWKQLAFIRVPDTIYRVVFGNPKFPIHLKTLISRFIKGLPDLTILFPDGHYLCVELKTKKGKLTQGQKNFARKIDKLHLIRSFEEFEKLVERKLK